jgi:hypothetical protein
MWKVTDVSEVLAARIIMAINAVVMEVTGTSETWVKFYQLPPLPPFGCSNNRNACMRVHSTWGSNDVWACM